MPWKKSAPSSEVARDEWLLLVEFWKRSGKWLLPKKCHFWGKSAPGSEAARDKWLLPTKVKFLEQVLPQAAQLPQTSGFFQKSRISEKKFCPGQVARLRKSDQPLQPRARSAFGGSEPPRKQGGAGGRSPPASRHPNLSQHLFEGVCL